MEFWINSCCVKHFQGLDSSAQHQLYNSAWSLIESLCSTSSEDSVLIGDVQRGVLFVKFHPDLAQSVCLIGFSTPRRPVIYNLARRRGAEDILVMNPFAFTKKYVNEWFIIDLMAFGIPYGLAAIESFRFTAHLKTMFLLSGRILYASRVCSS